MSHPSLQGFAHPAANGRLCSSTVAATYLLLTPLQNWGRRTVIPLELYVQSVSAQVFNPVVAPDGDDVCSPYMNLHPTLSPTPTDRPLSCFT